MDDIPQRKQDMQISTYADVAANRGSRPSSSMREEELAESAGTTNARDMQRTGEPLGWQADFRLLPNQ